MVKFSWDIKVPSLATTQDYNKTRLESKVLSLNPQKILGPKKLKIQNMLCPNKFWVRKVFSKNIGPEKKFLKIFECDKRILV